MEIIKTSHSTKNYVVKKVGRYCYCYSYGTPVARFQVNYDGTGGYIEFGKDWNYSPTTVRHVKWFLTEVRKWKQDGELIDVSKKSLLAYTRNCDSRLDGVRYRIPVINLYGEEDSIYCVK